jgi:FkbM family methyltransferase
MNSRTTNLVRMPLWYLFCYAELLLLKIVLGRYWRASPSDFQTSDPDRISNNKNQGRVRALGKFSILLAGKGAPPTCLVRCRGHPLIIRPVFFLETMMASGYWEPYVANRFKVRKGEVVMDVGAHIGYYAVQLAELLDKNGCYIAVEPDQRTLSLLKRNVSLNHPQNVILINAAVAKNSGFGELVQDRDPMFSMLVAKEKSLFPKKPVEIVSIDDLVSRLNLKRLDWIKLDIEGGEIAALEGAIDTMRRFSPKIIVETLETKLRLEALLTSEGYRLTQLSSMYFLAER